MPRPAWQGSTRRERLPVNWDELKEDALERNPERICHWCERPGGTTLDHKRAGDDHRPENLDWIHDRQDVKAGRSTRNCHGEKTGMEQAGKRPRLHSEPERHPAFD